METSWKKGGTNSIIVMIFITWYWNIDWALVNSFITSFLNTYASFILFQCWCHYVSGLLYYEYLKWRKSIKINFNYSICIHTLILLYTGNLHGYTISNHVLVIIHWPILHISIGCLSWVSDYTIMQRCIYMIMYALNYSLIIINNFYNNSDNIIIKVLSIRANTIYIVLTIRVVQLLILCNSKNGIVMIIII